VFNATSTIFQLNRDGRTVVVVIVW